MFWWVGRTISHKISGKHYLLAFFQENQACFLPHQFGDNLNRAAVDESQCWKSQSDITIDGILYKAFWLHPVATISESSQKRSLGKLERISEYLKSQRQATVW